MGSLSDMMIGVTEEVMDILGLDSDTDMWDCLGQFVCQSWNPSITTKEIARDFKIYNMDEVHNGYSRFQLREAFNKVCNTDNWKFPIYAEIPIAEQNVTENALDFFVGGHDETTIKDDKACVSSEGYYELIGA